MKIKSILISSMMLFAFGAVSATIVVGKAVLNLKSIKNGDKGVQPTDHSGSSKDSLLIDHLVKGASEPGSHSEGDVYLLIKIGKTEYVAELESGRVTSQRFAEVAGGGICGDYAEVTVNLLDKDHKETSQGAGQILRFKNGKWTMLALSEGDYSCEKLKGIPQSVLKCLKVECN